MSQVTPQVDPSTSPSARADAAAVAVPFAAIVLAMLPAVLDQNLVVTYGLAGNALPPPVDQAINQVVATTNQQTTVNSDQPGDGGETQSGGTGGALPSEKEKKNLPVCK